MFGTTLRRQKEGVGRGTISTSEHINSGHILMTRAQWLSHTWPAFVARLYWPICMLIAFCESIFNCPAVTIQLQRCNVCCMQLRHVCVSAAFNNININNTNISTHSIHQLLNRRYFLQSNFPIGFSFVLRLIATPWTNQLWDFEVLDLCSMLRLHCLWLTCHAPASLYIHTHTRIAVTTLL